MGSTVFRSDLGTGPEIAGHAPRRTQYIIKLPTAERELPKWETAIGWLMLVGKRGGDPMVPCIAVMKALREHEPKIAAAPRRKRAKAYKIVR